MIAVDGPNSRLIKIKEKEYVNFSGANYFDLAAREEVVSAAVEGCRVFGLSSDLGYDVATRPIVELEEQAAEFFGTESCVFCPSAYLAIGALITTLVDEKTIIFIDAHAHHSSFHFARMSGRPCFSFEHLSPSRLREAIDRALVGNPVANVMVLTDGIFPTFGEIAPLREIIDAVRNLPAKIIVDDAHGTGVTGASGRGTLQYLNISDPSVHYAASMSKAVGVQGAIIPTSSSLASIIKMKNSVYGSVSLPISGVAAAIGKSLSIISDGSMQARLYEKKSYFVERLGLYGIPITHVSPAPIVTFSLGSRELNMEGCAAAREDGYWVNVSNYTGSPAEGALRHAISISHTYRDLEGLASVYAKIGDRE